MRKKFALITTETSTYTSKKIIKEAQKTGAEVTVINPLKVSFLVNKNQSQVFWENKPLEKFNACYRKTTTTPIAKKLEHFLWEKGAKTINLPNKISYDGVPHSGGKFGVYQLLAKNKIPIPKSFLLTNPEEKEFCLNFFANKFPLIIKSNSGTHGIGVMIVDSKQAFVSLLDYLFKKNFVNEIIVQEFIKTSYGKDKRVIVLDNKILAAVERKNEKDDFRSNIFLGAKVYPTQLTAKEVSLALKAMQVLNLNFGGLDLLYGKNGPIITEINSPCDYSFVEKFTKVPITQKIVKFLLEA